MKLRRLRKAAQEKLGHYETVSYRQSGHEANQFGDMTYRQCRTHSRVRCGWSHAHPWREHV